MTLSPKIGGVVAAGLTFLMLIGYFFWRPGQTPPCPAQKAAPEAGLKATEAQREAVKGKGKARGIRGPLRDLNAKKAVVTDDRELR